MKQPFKNGRCDGRTIQRPVKRTWIAVVCAVMFHLITVSAFAQFHNGSSFPAAFEKNSYSKPTVFSSVNNISSALSLNEIKYNPTITLDPIEGVCQGSLVAKLSYSHVTGNPTLYTIEWDAPAAAQNFLDVNQMLLLPSPLTIVLPPGADPGIYTGKMRVFTGPPSLQPSIDYPISLEIFAKPDAPTLSVVDLCGYSTLTASNYSGTLVWSDGGSGNPRNVSSAQNFTVSQVINGCSSSPSNNVFSNPVEIPSAPVLTVDDLCDGRSLLTVSNYTGTLVWSDGGTGNPRYVNNVAAFSVHQVINGCSGTESNIVNTNPGNSPDAPVLTVQNLCNGTAVLTASSYTGSLTWSDGGTGNPRVVNVAGNYSVTQTVNGCSSAPSNTVTADPGAVPAAPLLTVQNLCDGTSILTASNYSGTLTWSDGGSGNPRIVNVAANYSVTQTINGCTSSSSNTVSTQPGNTPSAPVLTVVDNCDGTSVITASGYSGTLVWSDGGTGNPRVVNVTGNFSVTQTINGCTSAASNIITASPKQAPANPVLSSNGPVCAGNDLQLFTSTNAAIYEWTGPDGFVSSLQNPVIVNAGSNTSGVYTLTITDANGCTAVATINAVVTTPSSATINYSGSPYCRSVATSQPVVLTGTGTYTGGTFAASPAGLNINAVTGAVTPSSSVAGTYTVTYTRNGVGGCDDIVATTEVIITATPVAIFSYPGSPYCQSGANPLPELNGAAVAGVFSSAAGLVFADANTGEINLAASTPGTYTVVNTIAAANGCATVTASATVRVRAEPVASFSYAASPYCANAANPNPTFINGGVAGTFSSTPGLVFQNANTGRVDLQASTPGTYTVTNTISAGNGCAEVSATAVITITEVPNASIVYSGTPYCKSVIAPQPVSLSGSGDYLGGTFTATPAGLSIDAVTGEINPSASNAGNYTVRYTKGAAGGCASFFRTTTVSISAIPVATFSYPGSPYCANAANPLPVFNGGGVAGIFSSTPGLVFLNSTTGQVNLAASTPGTYTVTNTIAAANGCDQVTANSTIIITAAPDAQISYTGSPFCKSIVGDLNVNLTGTADYTGGTFSASPSGLSINPSTGAITPSTSNAGTYTITYTKTAANGCATISRTTSVVISALPVASFIYSSSPYCKNASNPLPTFSGGGVAGTFNSTPGLVFVNAATGQINLSASTAGTYTVTNTIAAANGCESVSATATVTINDVATASISYVGSPFCKSLLTSQPVTLNGTGNYTGGSFTSSPAGLSIDPSTGSINPSASNAGTYTVTYSRAASGGCAAINTTTNVNITNIPVAGFSYTGSPYCQSSGNPSPVFVSGGTAGTFTSTAGLVFVSASTGVINLAASTPGTYTVTNTIAAANGCATESATTTVIINQAQTANISYAGSPFCRSLNTAQAVTLTGTGTFSGGTFSALPAGLSLNPTTGAIVPSTSTAGTYIVSYVKAAAGGCPPISVSTVVTITTPPAATISYPASTYCESVVTPVNVIRTGSSGGVYSATPAGLQIDPVTGTVMPYGSTPATYTISYTFPASNGCPAVVANATVTIAPTPEVQILSDYCAGGGNVRLTASASPQPVNYLWSNGSTANTILIDMAGTYQLTATTPSGCSATAFTNVAVELVRNGDFSQGNTGFTSAYGVASGYYTGGSTGLWPESLYAVDSNANKYHSNFFGKDHTTGDGKFMIVNGAGVDTTTVWRQSFAVQPYTTYYFSSWAMSLNTVTPYARLKFLINDSLFGTTAVLPAGNPTPNGPFTWERFYGTWNSGSNTFVTIAIVDLQTAAGGNDFGLDDISFGTLSPTPFAAAPTGSACLGGALQLFANRTGGSAPYSYSWTGPNGFTSNQQNPVIPNSTAANAGTYTLVSNDAYGCPVTASTTVVVNPVATANAGSPQTVCAGGTVTLNGAVGGAATSGTWSAPSGTFSNPNALNSTYTPSITSGTVTLTLTTNDPAGPCPPVTSTVVITVNPAAIVDAGADRGICSSGAILLAGTIGGSATSATWSAPSGTFSNVNSLTSTYTPSIASGSVTLTLTTNDPAGSCPAVSNTMVVTVSNGTTANAGTPQTVCAGGSVTLNGTIGGSASTATWTAPSGTFSSPTSLTSTYTPSITSGSVTLTLTTNDPPGICTPAVSTVVINVMPSPSVSVPTPAAICIGSSLVLNATNSNGSLNPVFTASSGAVNLAVPDNSTTGVSSPIYLPGINGVTLSSSDILQVTLNIDHNSISDIDIYLVDPSGTRAILLAHDNGNTGDDYTNTVLRTNLSNIIGSTGNNTAPFNGNFRPEGTISTDPDRTGAAGGGNYNSIPANDLRGAPIEGNWTLRVFDDASGTTGTLLNWSLSITKSGTYTTTFDGPANISSVTYSGTGNTTASATVTPPVGANVYTITTTDVAGCSRETAVTVNTGDIATVDAGFAMLACRSAAPTPITLSGATIGGTATTGAWSIISGGGTLSSTAQTADPASVTYTPAANFSGTVTLRLTTNDPAGACGSVFENRTITVNAPTAITFPSITARCITSAPVQLTATPAGGTYSGTGVTAGGLFDPALAGAGTKTITYSYTNAFGCVGTASINIVVSALPVVSAGTYSPVCVNVTAVNLTGSPSGGTFSGTAVTGSVFNPSVAGAGTHTITYTYTTAGGCTNSATANIIVNALPVVSAGLYPQVCVNSASFALSGLPSGGVYSGPGVSGNTFNPATAGAGTHTITYVYTNANGCVNSATTTITVNAIPSITFPAYGPYCINAAAVQLAATPAGGTYSGVGVSATGLFNPSVAGAGNHTITYSVTNASGCVATLSRTITVVALPVISAGTYSPRCVNITSVPLTGNPSGGTFSGTGVSGNVFNPSVAGVGTHTITYNYTNAAGCANTATTTITVNALPVVNAGTYSPLCIDGGAVTLSGSPSGGTFSGPGVSGSTFNPAGAGAGTHTITYSYTDANGCSSSATTTITVNPLPVISLPAVAPVCVSAAAVQLNGSPAGGVYSGPGVSATGLFTPSVAGTGVKSITYTYTNANGCTASVTRNITVNALPTVSAGTYGAVCISAGNITLSGSPAGGVFSGTGVSGNSFSPAVAGVGTHTINYSYTNGSGCTNTATTTITVNALPVVSAGTYPAVCINNGIVNLAGSPSGGTFSGAGVTGMQFNPAVSGAGTHLITYTYTDGNGCTASATTSIVVNPLPVVSLPAAGPYCISAADVQLNSSPAGGVYSGTGVNATGLFSPSAAGAGTHAVTYTFTDANGCVNAVTRNITVTALPVVSAGTYSAVCINASNINLTGSPTGGIYSGPGVSGTIFNPSVAGAGTHTITYVYTNAAGCSNTATATITVNPLPVVNAGNYGPVCINAGNIILAGSPAGGTFSGPGVTGTTFNPVTAGAGTHTITYSYTSNGCLNTSTTSITVNPLPVVSIAAAGPYCVNAAAVQLVGTPSGGTFSGTGVNATGLFNPSVAGTGSHVITYHYTNANGCSASSTRTIVVNALPVANAGVYTAICISANPIALTGSPSGGVFSGAGVTGSTFNPAIAGVGTHTITYNVTNANGCSSSATSTITVNALPVVSAGTYGAVCISNGVVSLSGSPAGGSFSGTGVSGNSFNPAIAGLGTHTITYSYTNGSGCTNTATATIVVNALPVVNLPVAGPYCLGAAPVQLSGSPAGGVYSGAGVNATGLFNPTTAGIGTHTITYTFTDANGCINTATRNIVVQSLPVVNAGTYNAVCISNGVIALSGSPAGGTFSGPGVTASIFNPAVAGAGTHTITYTYTNGSGCTNTATSTITVNALPVVSAGNYNAVCINSGSVTLSGSPAGGTFSGPGVTGTSFNPAAAGAGTHTITYTFTNGSGCTSSANATIVVNAIPVVSLPAVAPMCIDAAALQLNGSPTGGTYSGNGVNASGLFNPSVAGAGTHLITYTYTNGNGCTAVATRNIIVNNLPVVSAGIYAPVCIDGGSVTLSGSPAGGTFSGTGVSGNIFNPSIAGAGTHVITYSYTNSNGCSATATTSIVVNALPVVNVSGVDIACAGEATGSATATVSGGTGPYTFSWNTVPVQNGTTATGLVAGTYTVTVTDAAGCSTTGSITLSQPTTLTATTAVTNILCNGASTGSVVITPAGGVAPYTITPAQTGLAAGNHVFTVTDANGCSITVPVTISQPSTLTATTAVTNILCNGAATGSVVITPSGGVGPYTITPAQTGLAAGNHVFTVTDANGCSITVPVTITQPTTLTATTAVTNILCNGASTGSVVITPAGGVAPYTITPAQTGLAAGNHVFTVTDANGCSITVPVTITQPTTLTATTAVTNILCNGAATGSVVITPAGGVAPYFITPAQTGLAAGNHTFTVTDANGCSITVPVTINQPSTLTATTAVTNILCNGAATGSVVITPAGGVAPYTITPAQTGLAAGNHVFTVTDANGCSITVPVTITEPSTLTATTAVTNILCNGAATGSVVITPAGGVGPYTITPAQTGLAAGNHVFTITDVNGCSITVPVTISQPSTLTATTAVTNILCNGAATGSVVITPAGGVGPYTITPAQTGLAAGSHTFTVTDANGCSITVPVTITQPTTLTATTAVTNILCNGTSTGSLVITPTGGVAPYTITPAQTGLAAGNHVFTVTDANGCSITVPVTITEPSTLTATTAVTNILCNGTSTGSVVITPTGGVGPYTITPAQTGLAAGNHVFTVTDANGCSITVPVTISQPSTLTATTAVNNILCNGAATGSVVITPTGGVAPYTITPAQTGLAAGNHVFTVTDANGCSIIVPVTITQPTALSATTQVTDALCGSATGSVVITPAGGVAPYTITPAQTGLAAGNYTFTVTDANGCTLNVPVTISQPSALSATAAVTNVLCHGAATGAVTITATGGVGPYTITPAQTGLAAGSYTFTVTDANGCTFTVSATVTQPAALSANTVVTNVLCNGGSTGSVVITPTGGVAPYTITPAQIGLAAGSHTFTVTDANGCSITVPVTITQPSTLTATTAVTNILCNGAATGSVVITPNGGVAPYTITPSQTGLAAGNHVFTVTDANGCSITVPVTITQPSTLTATTVVTNILCNGAATGSVVITPSGGVGPYTITPAQTGLAAGNHVFTVTDANGCSITVPVTITQPPTLTATTAVTNILCNGAATGSVVITPAGGVGPYSITPAQTGLAAGNHVFTVTDANGCSITVPVTITEPSTLTATTAITNILCNGAATGSVIITPAGGVAPYTITPAQTGLAAGNHVFTVTDANGCSITVPVTISQPSTLTATTAVTNILCNGAATGSVVITPAGGVAPYSITPAQTGLAAGNHVFTVTDANGCSITVPITISQPSTLTATTAVTNILCNGASTGSVVITPSGGVAPYTITPAQTGLAAGNHVFTVTDANGCSITVPVTITQPSTLTATTAVTNILCNGAATGSVVITPTGGVAPYSITPAQTGLAAGNHTFTVTDANGCSITVPVTINQPSTLTATTAVTNILCNGAATGSVVITPAGGVGPYTITPAQTGLAAGNHVFTVTDANGCSIIVPVTITQPSTLTATTAVTNILCNGAATGSVVITPAGGVAPYSITPAQTGLAAGNHVFTVTDANGCSITVPVTITQPSTLTATTAVTNILCNGAATGSVVITPNGGVGPYTITPAQTGLAAGNHVFTVTDANGCSITVPVTISQPTTLTATTAVTNILCNGAATGSVVITPSGGVGPYTITPAQTGLAAGNHVFTVTDANGCSITVPVTITQPTTLTATTAVTNILCNGASTGSVVITPNGGVAPYTITPAQTGLAAGNHVFTVTDANGCSITVPVTITQPSVLTAGTQVTDAFCGQSNGSVIITPTGGVGPYTISPAQTGLAAGNYNFTVTDANGCSIIVPVTISQPSALSATAIVNNVLCNGAATGSVVITPLGGVGPYSITPAQNGLAAGNHVFTVTDANGCTFNVPVTITQPSALTATTAITNILCNGAATGSVVITPAGGVAPYSITPAQTGLAAGNHVFTVTDANGCSISVPVTITQPSTLTATTAVTNILCNGAATGSVVITPTGGVAPYTITPAQTGLAAGNHVFTVTDANGCSITVPVTITQPTTLTATTAITNILCNGAATGSVIITPAGGVAPYTITPAQTGLAAGNHTFTVTDANGCSITVPVTITEPSTLTATTAVTNILCNGAATGSVVITPTGGVAPYTITPAQTGLAAGNHVFTVTDANGCSITVPVTITQPTTLTATTAVTNILCNGAATGSVVITPAGGVGPYTITPAQTGLAAGNHVFTVTDANGCSITVPVTITQPTTLTATTAVTNILCNGASTGSVVITPTGGVAPYTIIPAQTGLAAGNHVFTVTDANGCSITVPVTITQPSSLTATTAVTNILCNGAATGSVVITPAGGVAPYTITPAQTGLAAGNHVFTVTDANGCSITVPVTITQPSTLTATTAVTNILCNGAATGSVLITPSGGVGPYSITPAQTGLAAGNHVFTVTDANGCSITVPVTITQPATITATTAVTNILCNGEATGSVVITPTGGIAPYTITPAQTGLAAGNHVFTVTDANGCSITVPVTITQPTTLTATTAVTNILCNGAATGSVVITPAGGVAPYTITPAQTGLAAGNHVFTVTDANGCSITVPVTISQPSTLTATTAVNNILCNGAATGSVVITPAGGVAPYTITPAQTGLAAGNHMFTVTDANGCSITVPVTITQPSTLTATTAVTNILCNGAATGSVVISPAGGVAPYTITPAQTGLNAGNYTFTVTDANGCSITVPVTITQPSTLTASTDVNNILCNGASTGSVVITPTGGVAPYTITPVQTGLAAGNHVFTVTDANGCSITVPVTITEPSTLTATTAITNAFCGQANGSVVITPSGGVAPYTITPAQNNLVAGSYNFTVTDANGCILNVPVIISQPSALTASASITNILCNGASTGSVVITPSGGVAPYTITPSQTGLAAGNHTFTVTDANGCSVIVPVTITEPSSLTASTVVTNILCNGSATGSVVITPTGGVGPYTITPAQTGLAAGNHLFTVIDANGCSIDVPVVITQPLALTATTAIQNVACNGGSTGSVVITPSGGVGPYTITPAQTGLAAGNYVFTVTDANGCSITVPVTITEPSILTATTAVTNILCNGAATGSVVITPAGGVAPYSITPAQTGLAAGNHVFTVTDANGCSITVPVTITEPSTLTATTAITNILCNGAATGSVVITPSGGVAPYTITPAQTGLTAGNHVFTVTDANGCSITVPVTITEPSILTATTALTNILCNGAATGSVVITPAGGVAPYSITPAQTGLAAGSHTFTVTDANGCSITVPVTITQPSTLTATTAVTNILCNGAATGSVVITPAGGVAPYSITPAQTGLAAGSHTFTVTDANGCSITVPVTITQPSTLTATTAVTNILCNGAATGSVIITPAGGVAPFTITPAQTGLAAGNHVFTVTDANGCSITVPVTITQPTTLTATTAVTNILCNGAATASVVITPAGGVAPYTITPAQTGLSAGNHTFTVTDANGCSITVPVTITEPSTLTATTAVTNILCNGAATGSVVITPSGGVAPYTITPAQTGLAAGNHVFTVTDANGCSITVPVTITEPSTLTATTAITNISL